MCKPKSEQGDSDIQGDSKTFINVSAFVGRRDN